MVRTEYYIRVMLYRWKHLIAFILLLVFTFSTCFSGLLLNVQLVVHRVEMRTGRATNEHFVLLISEAEIKNADSDFYWLTENEFSYRGKLFDAVELSKMHDKWIIVCKNDAFEETLLEMLGNHSKESNQAESGVKKNYKYNGEFPALTDLVQRIDGVCCTFHTVYKPLHTDPYSPLRDPPPWLG